MDNGRRITWGAAGAGLLALACLAWPRKPDPIVQSRPLGHWIQHYIQGTPAERAMAAEVLARAAPLAAPRMSQILLAETPAAEPWLHRAAGLLRLPGDMLPPPTPARKVAALLWLDSAGTNAAPAADGLVALLQAQSPNALREKAADILRRLGPQVAAALANGLSHSDPKVREESLGLLAMALDDPGELLRHCLSKCQDPSPGVRKQVANLLSGERFPPGLILPSLELLARDPDPAVREAAAGQLARPWSGEAPGSLLRSLLDDPIPVVRLVAARGLWAKTQDPAAVLPTLRRDLGGPEGWRAALYLGELGPEAAPAIPDLLSLMRRETTYRPFRTPSATTLALGRVGPAAVPGLREMLSDANPSARLGAILSLGMIGAGARDAAPELAGLLNARDLDSRHLAALSLGQIGDDSPRVLTRLEDCLRAEDIHMRSLAATLLNRLAPGREWRAAPE